VSHTGEAQAVYVLDTQLLKLVPRANHLRIVLGVAQAAQRNDRVQHRRIDGAQPVRHLEARQNPLLRFAQGQRA
jgi:hypothetical protein